MYDGSLGQYRRERYSGDTGDMGDHTVVYLSEVVGEPWSEQQCHCQTMHSVITSVSNIVTGEWADIVTLSWNTGDYKLCFSYIQSQQDAAKPGLQGLSHAGIIQVSLLFIMDLHM